MMRQLFTKLNSPPGIFLLSFIIFGVSWLIVFLTGINTHAIQSEDTLPAIILPVTIIKEGTLNLNTYYPMLLDKYPHPDDKNYIKGLVPYYLRRVGDNYLSAFTIITPLIALPIYLVPVLADIPINWTNLIILSKIASIFIVSLSGYFLYRLVFYLSNQKNLTFLVTSIYLFGTINYALLSQSLWQHGTVNLLVILSLYSYYHKNYYLSLLFAGFCVLSRPTAIIIIPFLLILYFLDKRKKFKIRHLLTAILGFLLPILFFIWYNNTYYTDITNQGYSDQLLDNWRGRFPESFFGIWLSPSKGVFVYSPIFIFSLAGLVVSLKSSDKNKYLYLLSWMTVLIHSLIMSFWKHWYGGYGFGYRMMGDVLVYLTLPFIPWISSNYFDKYVKLFWILFIVSVVVQIAGIVFFDGIWHAAYDRGFVDTAWLWSIKDSEFMFNFRRILVKIGFLDRACPLCE